MGMIVYVHRSSLGDSTNNGISKDHDRLTVINVDGPFKPSDDAPAAVLVKSALPNGLPHLEPADAADKWTMNGGNIASTSDSRWSRAIEAICGVRASCVNIHDRIE